MNIIVLRGLPGAGKSRLARAIPGALVVSADQFFTAPDGTYAFDPAQLGAAHGACLRRFLDVLRRDPIDQPATLVVDNTHTSVAELAPYMALAAAYGCPAAILEVACDPAVAALHATLRAHDALLPPWWPRTVVAAAP